MKSQAKLLRQISDRFHAGIGFAEFMSFEVEDPEFDFLSQELQSARKWIDRAYQQSGPEYWEKFQNIVELLGTCAEMIRRNGYEFLAADFEDLVDDAVCLRAEITALEG